MMIGPSDARQSPAQPQEHVPFSFYLRSLSALCVLADIGAYSLPLCATDARRSVRLGGQDLRLSAWLSVSWSMYPHDAVRNA